MYNNMTFDKRVMVGTTAIGYTFVPAIPGYGARLYVQRGFGVATALIKGLNALSIWGGYDKDGENFVSWELPKELTEEILVKFMREMLNN